MYVQTSDGTWLHYANASDVGPKPLGGLEQLAQDNIAGTTAQQILALATGVQKTAQPDGTTVYTGTIPNSSLDPAIVPGNDAITSMILGAQKRTAMMFGAGQRGRRPWRPTERSPAPDERRRRRPRQASQRDLPAGRAQAHPPWTAPTRGASRTASLAAHRRLRRLPVRPMFRPERCRPERCRRTRRRRTRRSPQTSLSRGRQTHRCEA